MTAKQSSPIRVLVVDDSFFMRRVISDVLQNRSELTVVGQAADGSEAIAQTEKLRPDVIVLDYQMPAMTGAQTIKEILTSFPDSPPAIIMLSAHTSEGAEETFECLQAGAVDFITKPSGELSVSIKGIEEKLVGAIMTAAGARVQPPISFPRSEARKKTVFYPSALKKIIIIGASTGGPVVLEKIMTALPADLPAAVIVVQHMPEFFISRFVLRLDRAAPLDLRQARGGEILTAGMALFAPGDQNLELRGRADQTVMAKVMPAPPTQLLRPSIDVTMKSAAALGPKVIGVILTGMGDDGASGMAAIRRAGGYAIIQELESAVVDSMPRAVLERRQVDEILSPEKIAPRLIQLCC